MPDVTPETQVSPKPVGIRADIAARVGLDPTRVAEIAKQRAQEAEVVRTSKRNGAEIYDKLKNGQEVDSIDLGVGQFDLSPTDKVDDLVPNLEKRVREINPPPPQEHIKLFLDSFATKALEDKNFGAAVASYNYITDEHLDTPENAKYIDKLTAGTATEDEKYDLGLALEQVLPQAQVTREVPQETIVHNTTEPQAATTAPVSAESIAADEVAWRAAAGIDTTLSAPKIPISASPLPEADLLASSPPVVIEHQQQPGMPAPFTAPAVETLPQTIRAEVPPAPTPAPTLAGSPITEQLFPQPTPITISNSGPLIPSTTAQPTITQMGPNLRPVPTREEAAAQGLIEDVASRIPTGPPPISSSEAELASAA